MLAHRGSSGRDGARLGSRALSTSLVCVRVCVCGVAKIQGEIELVASPGRTTIKQYTLMKRPSRVVQPEDVVQHEVVAWRRGHELENLRKLERVLLSLHLRESGTSRAREKKSRQTGKAALEKNEGKIGSARETMGRNRERETDFGASLISLSVRVR